MGDPATSTVGAAEIAVELERMRVAGDRAQRTAGVFAVVTLMLLAFALLTLHPGFASAFGTGPAEMGVLCSIVWLTMAAAAASYHRLGGDSRLYRTLNRIETFVVQGAILFLVYRSGRPDSFVWIVYFIHLVASVPLGLGIDLKLMCATPLLVAAAFHFHDGNDAAAGFAIGASLLAFFFVTMMLQTQTALARGEAERQKLHGELADLRLEQERGRIARDLHDGLGADLTAIAWRLEALLSQHRESPIAASLGQLAGRLRLATDDLRSVVWLIRTPELRCGELTAHLRSRGLEIAPPGVAFTLEVNGGEDDPAIPGEVALHLVLAFQEAVRNAAQHAAARAIKARLELIEGRLERLVIDDDGGGFDAARATRPEGGVSNLRTRATALGATLAISSAASGTRVEIVRAG